MPTRQDCSMLKVKDTSVNVLHTQSFTSNVAAKGGCGIVSTTGTRSSMSPLQPTWQRCLARNSSTLYRSASLLVPFCCCSLILTTSKGVTMMSASVMPAEKPAAALLISDRSPFCMPTSSCSLMLCAHVILQYAEKMVLIMKGPASASPQAMLGFAQLF